MSVLNDLTCLTKTYNIEELEQNRDNELLRIYKLELILSILKNSPIEKFQHSDRKNLTKSIKIISIQNYIKLDDNISLLGLDSCKTIDILYTERKAIVNLIKDEISKKCTPIVNYVKDVQKKWPGIFDKEQKRTEILVIEEKRQQLYILLSELKSKKYELLKLCAEMKLGPYLRNELHLRLSNYKLNQIKVNVLKSIILNEFCSSPDHVIAFKEVTKYIEEQLEE